MEYGSKTVKKEVFLVFGKQGKQAKSINEQTAYDAICKYAKNIGCSAILWHKHFGYSLLLCKCSLEVGKFYSATNEQLFDILGMYGKIIKCINFKKSCRSIEEIAIALELNV